MNPCYSSHQRIGRRTRLANCLSIALALSASGAVCASPGQIKQAGKQTTLIKGSTTGLTTQAAVSRHTTVRSAMRAMLVPNTTRVVSNCDNAGNGSLRDTIALANSGDTVDLSSLPDCTISLLGPVVITVDDLTIQGKPGTFFVFPLVSLSGQSAIRPLTHTGTGKLRLKDMSIHDGLLPAQGSTTAQGGCLYSAGDIYLTDSFMQDCSAHAFGTGAANGGAIFSLGSVFLDNTRVTSSTAISASGSVRGGGIYSQVSTVVQGGSLILGNDAMTDGNTLAMGGGVFSWSQMVVVDSIVTGNTASSAGEDAYGGGIAAQTSLSLYDSQVTNNTVQSGKFLSYSKNAYGGGIWVNGDFALHSSTIAGNQAVTDTTGTGGFSMGGGIAANGDVDIDRSTISGNMAERVAGVALAGGNALNPLSISNSTISGNVSSKSPIGSGLFLGHDAGVFNCTITDNTESNLSDSVVAAGLYVNTGASVELSSSIVSGNRLHRGDNTDIPSDVGGGGGNSGDHDLVGHSTLQWGQGDVIKDNTPNLGPLADNGGPTKTHALLSSSQAINAGLANGESTDQRDTGFPRTVGPTADIGAYELQIVDRIFANGFEVP